MVKTKFIPKNVDYAKVAFKSKTIPDQTLSIQELVRRFVRGIPANVVQRDPIFLNDPSVDFEGLGRLDPVEKAYRASELQAENEANAIELKRRNEEVQAMREEQTREKQAEKGAQQTGIGSLDNTMPDDTESDSQSVRGQKKSTKKG